MNNITQRMRNKEEIETKLLHELVIEGMQERKAEDIVVIDLRSIGNSVADFFVLCTGNSDTQVEAIATSVEKHVYKIKKESPRHVEGKNTGEWVLIDYVDVIAHVFKQDKRDFYHLESLWGDAKVTSIPNLI